MKTYVQLKDGIAFSYIETDKDMDGLILLDEGISPESVLNKKYENEEWLDVEKIYYVSSLTKDGKISMIDSTYFPSDVTGEIVSSEVDSTWVKINGEWTDIVAYQNETRPQYNSWYWDQESLSWLPPVPKPIDGNEYVWNEESVFWDLV